MSHDWAFRELASALHAVRPEYCDVVICPLCLRHFTPETIADLSVEHIVPSKLRGTTTTLTCRSCNNRQGARFDSQLVAGTKAVDAAQGMEPLRGVWRTKSGPIALDVTVRKVDSDVPNLLEVIPKASHQAAINAARFEIYDGATIDIELSYGFSRERYWAAAIRAAYLAVFANRGYSYVFSHGGTQVRSVMAGHAPVPAHAAMTAYPDAELPSDLLVMSNVVKQSIVVLMKLVRRRAHYLAVFLPGDGGLDWNALTPLHAAAPRLKLETTPDGSSRKLSIRLDQDPATQFGNGGELPFR